MKYNNQSQRQQGCDCDHPDDGKNADSTAIETAMTETQVQARRSRIRAGETAEIVNRIATITDRDYCHALTPKQDKLAFLLPIGPEMAETLTFVDGKLNMGEYKLSLSHYSKEQLAVLDFTTLQVLYSVILQQLENELEKTGNPAEVLAILKNPSCRYTVTLYLPDYLRMIGAKPNQDEAHVMAAIRKLQSYSNLIGIHTTHKGNRTYDNQYAVMQWDSYIEETNTITFGSPYLTHIARQILHKNLRTDKANKVKTTKSGRPISEASHSYMLSTLLASERNKRAVEILTYIDRLIETAGTVGVAHAKVSTIISECPELEYALERCSSKDKNILLKRAFSKAWALMRDRKYSDLCERYKDLQIPDMVPTVRDLNMTLEFPHNGKR